MIPGNSLLKPEKASFPILPGYRLGQIFKSISNNINQIDLYFGCYARKNTCTLKFTLAEITNLNKFEYNNLFTQEISASDLIDNKKFSISFSTLSHIKDKIFYFYIESKNASVENCVCLWLNNFAKDDFAAITNNKFDFGSVIFQYGEKEEIQLISIDRRIENITADIIICVYNQINFVEKCINSIQTKTLFPNYKIIVIDDGSSIETRERLKQLKNIDLHLLSQNLGYVKAANYGLKISTADYKILLNSDTEVTEGWLTKAIVCGESSSKIGILGLLSNNATWQSIPEYFSEQTGWAYQDIPFPYSIDEFSLLVEALSEKRYPRVGHVHGSCFIIKREVIEQIGLFDEQNFHLGYHEEDDYCLRAREAGFELVWVDNAFYFHHGRKSFTPQKRSELIKLNSVYYNQKWGATDRYLLEDLKKNNPVDYLRAKLKNFLELKYKDLQQLKIAYLLNPGNSRGGGAISIFQIISCLQKLGFNVNLACLRKTEKSLLLFSEFNIQPFYYDTLEELKAANFDVLIGTHNNTVEEALLECYKSSPNLLTGYFIQDFEPFFYLEGTEDYKKALRSYTIIPEIIAIAKTEWICNIVEEKTGLKVFKAPPGLNTTIFRSTIPRNYIHQKLKIAAMVRPQTPRRNPQGTLLALKQIKEKYADLIEIIIFGASDDALEKHDLKQAEYLFNYKNLGHIDGFELAKLFNEIDIFLDGSIYQAFGRTALEAMACGAVCIVPQNGGVFEYALDRENCLIIDTSKIENMVLALELLINNSGLREKLSKQGILDAKEFTIEKEAKEHLRIFAKYHARKTQEYSIQKNHRLIENLKYEKFGKVEEVKFQNSLIRIKKFDLNIDYYQMEDTRLYSLLKVKEDYINLIRENKLGTYFPVSLDLLNFNKADSKEKNFEICYIHYNNQFLRDVLYPLFVEFPQLKCHLFPIKPVGQDVLRDLKQIKIKNITFFPKISKSSLLTIIPDYGETKEYDFYLTALLNENILFTSKQKLPFLKHELTGYLLEQNKLYWLHFLKYILKNPNVRVAMSANSYQSGLNYLRNNFHSTRIADFLTLIYDLETYQNV